MDEIIALHVVAFDDSQWKTYNSYCIEAHSLKVLYGIIWLVLKEYRGIGIGVRSFTILIIDALKMLDLKKLVSKRQLASNWIFMNMQDSTLENRWHKFSMYGLYPHSVDVCV